MMEINTYTLAGSFWPEEVKSGLSHVSSSNRISLLRCTAAFVCKCQHASNVTFPFFCFLKWVHTYTLALQSVSRGTSHYSLSLIHAFGTSEQAQRCQTHWSQWGWTPHQVDEADKEMDVVEAFKVCHTSRKNGMSAVARDVVVSPFYKTFVLLCPTLSVHDASCIVNVHGYPCISKVCYINNI
jgi:hypothetical protein